MYFVKRNHYKKIAKGTYQYVGDDTFKLYKLNHRSPGGVLSHNTVLFYHGMLEKMPGNPSITLGIGYNSKNFTKSGVKVYTVKKELLYLGLINREDVFGDPYHVYDLDRTMVDLVRSRKGLGESFVWEMLRKYLAREDKDLEKLFKYTKVFRADRILKEAIEKSTSFSIKLKQIRSALGKSQMTIATDLGCPNSRISYYEQGIMEPTHEELERICTLYGGKRSIITRI